MELERFKIWMPISHLILLINHQSASNGSFNDALMMCVDSHHSLSLFKRIRPRIIVYIKRKGHQKIPSFFFFFWRFSFFFFLTFFFFELGAQYKTKTRNKEHKRNKIGLQQETKGKRIVNLILEPRLWYQMMRTSIDTPLRPSNNIGI